MLGYEELHQFRQTYLQNIGEPPVSGPEWQALTDRARDDQLTDADIQNIQSMARALLDAGVTTSGWQQIQIRFGDTEAALRRARTSEEVTTEAQAVFRRYEDVSVVYLGVSGFTGENAQEAMSKLDRFATVVRQVVTPLNGYVKMIGDKAIIVFGTQDVGEGEDFAVINAMRALQAVQMIQSRLSARNPELILSAGIQQGELVAGEIGAVGVRQYDVLGNDVNIAQRLYLVAKEQSSGASHSHAIVVGEGVQDNLAKGGLEVTASLGEQNLKGVGDQNVYTVTSNFEGPSLDVSLIPEASLIPRADPSDLADTDAIDTAQYRDVYGLSIDIVGFSTLSARMTPTEIATWLTQFYDIAEPVVVRNHGVLIDRRGDEIQVRFGVPAVGDNAINAVLTAVELREAMIRYNQETSGLPISFRIGVSHGRALVRGTTTVGDVMDEAAQLQADAPVNGILVDATTAQNAHDYFVFKTNVSERPVEVSSALRQEIEVRRQQLESLPLVGRDAQVGQVDEAFAEARRGRLQTRLMVGSEGSGRQSVVTNFLSNVAGQVVSLSGRASSVQRDPLRAALMQALSNESFEEDPDVAWDRFMAASHVDQSDIEIARPQGFASDAEFMRVILANYLGIPLESVPAGMSLLLERPERLNALTQQVVARYLDGLSQTQPLVLALYDIENANRETLAFIQKVLGHLQYSSVFVLGTASTQIITESEILETYPGYETVNFGNLDQKTSEAFVLETLGREDQQQETQPDRLSRRTSTALFLQSGGQPLYLAELARAYYRNGWMERAAVGSGQEWQLNLPAGARIPRTLDEALLSRFDRLSTDDARLFRAASAMAAYGGVFWTEALESFLVGPPTTRTNNLFFRSKLELSRALERLERQGLVVKETSSLTGKTAYRVVPARLAELAYGTLTESAKTQLHAYYYQWYVNSMDLDNARYEAQASAAYHAEGAGLLEEAYYLYEKAASRTRVYYAYGLSIQYSESALRILDLWDPKEKDFHKLNILKIMCSNYERTTEFADWNERIVEMERLVRDGKGVTVEQKIETLITRASYNNKTVNFEIEWFKDAEAYISQHTDAISIDRLMFFYGIMADSLRKSGQVEESIRVLENVIHYGLESGDRATIAGALFQQSYLLHSLGRYEESYEVARRSAELYNEIGFEANQARAISNASDCMLNLKRYEEAALCAAEAYQLGSKTGENTTVVLSLLNWVKALIYLDRVPEGLERLNDLERINDLRSNPIYLSFSYIFKALLISKIDPAESKKLADMAEQALIEAGMMVYRASALVAKAIGHYRLGEQEPLNDILVELLNTRAEKGAIEEFGDEELLQLAALNYDAIVATGQLSEPAKQALKPLKDALAKDAKLLSPLLREQTVSGGDNGFGLASHTIDTRHLTADRTANPTLVPAQPRTAEPVRTGDTSKKGPEASTNFYGIHDAFDISSGVLAVKRYADEIDDVIYPANRPLLPTIGKNSQRSMVNGQRAPMRAANNNWFYQTPPAPSFQEGVRTGRSSFQVGVLRPLNRTALSSPLSRGAMHLTLIKGR